MAEQTNWCPKHCVAHGVCVEPIKTEIPPDKEPERVELTTCPKCLFMFEAYEPRHTSVLKPPVIRKLGSNPYDAGGGR